MVNFETPNMFEKRFYLQPDDSHNIQAIIKVIGVGGCGNNAVEHMISESIGGVDFYVANTDAQALAKLNIPQRIQIGKELTKGLGAGSKPEIGREAALEDIDTLVEHLKDADMVFITAGLGGGTGTGAAPVIAAAIKEAKPDLVVVAVVTTPFEFEGVRRIRCAKDGLVELKSAVDSLITIPNEKLLSNTTTMKNAYKEADAVLINAVKGIADLVMQTGFINVDFADVRTVMSEAGQAVMATGKATGENRAEDAIRNAIDNPLLEDIDVADAKGILINVTSNSDMTPQEFSTIGRVISEVASDDAMVITGQKYDDAVGDEIRVTIVATGLGDEDEQRSEVSKFADSPVNGTTPKFEQPETVEPVRVDADTHEPAVLRSRFNFSSSQHDAGNGFIPRN